MRIRETNEIGECSTVDISALAREMEAQGHDIIHLELGDPWFKTPRRIRDAAIEAIRSGETHYTHPMGLPGLREAITNNYYGSFGVEVSSEQVLITSGTSQALLFAMMALIDPGDEVIVPSPGYPSYSNCIRAAKGVPVEILTSPEHRFFYTQQSIQRALNLKTRAIMINSPGNPSGQVMTEGDFLKIARFEKLYIISDEIYDRLVYMGKAHSILEFTDRAFVVNGFSKAFAMTGWRIGYLIFPHAFASIIKRLQMNFAISTNTFVQYAGLAALTESQPELRYMKKSYNENRLYMLDKLREIGFTIHVEPAGAFYIFADARGFCDDSHKEALSILENTGVCVAPGIDFGKDWEGFFRFSFCNSFEAVKEGLLRVKEYYRQVSPEKV